MKTLKAITLFLLLAFPLTILAQQSSSDIVEFIVAKVSPDKIEAYKRAALQLAAQTRKEEGNLSIEVIQSLDDPTEIDFLARFKSQEALEAHMDAPYRVEFAKEQTNIRLSGYPIRKTFRILSP